MIPSVAASERGLAQTSERAHWGCGTLDKGVDHARRSGLEQPTIGGKSPVVESVVAPEWIPSSAGHVKPRMNPAGPSAKAKYSLATDSEPVP